MLKLQRTGVTKCVEWCRDMISMYFLTVDLVHFSIGCYTNVNHFTALLLVGIWDLIARWNIPMPMKGSCLNSITSEFKTWQVQEMTAITPFHAKFPIFLPYNTSAKCNSVHKPHGNLLDTHLNLTSTSKYFQMLPGPPGAKHSALRLYNSILTCSCKHLQWWRCIQCARILD